MAGPPARRSRLGPTRAGMHSLDRTSRIHGFSPRAAGHVHCTMERGKQRDSQRTRPSIQCIHATRAEGDLTVARREHPNVSFKSFLAIVSMVGISSVATAALAELALRLWEPHQNIPQREFDPALGWRGRAGL